MARTFAQTSKKRQPTATDAFAKLCRAHSGQSREVRAILRRRHPFESQIGRVIPKAKTTSDSTHHQSKEPQSITHDRRRMMTCDAVEQDKPDISATGDLFIQRQVQTSNQPATSGGSAASQLAHEYVELACEVIADIKRSIEQGRTWHFEDELLLQGEEWLLLHQNNLADARIDVLQQLVRGIDEIIQDVESGTLVPTAPANRRNLSYLWAARNSRSVQSLARRWAPPYHYVRLPNGRIRRYFPSLRQYIEFSATSPEGMLPSAEFPTWWVLSCHQFEQDEDSPTGSERITPAELEQNTVIFVSKRDNVVTGWDYVPRSDSYFNASFPFGPYEWQYAQRVFIVVDGQEVNLLRDGRVEIPR